MRSISKIVKMCVGLLAAWWGLGPVVSIAAQSEIVTTGNAQTQLIIEKLGIAPGETMTVMMRQQLRELRFGSFFGASDLGDLG